MAFSFGSRLKHAWNAFFSRDPTFTRYEYGPGYSSRPDKVRSVSGGDRTIATAIFNRIALDATSIDIKHVRLDEHGRYLEDMPSCLNDILDLSANIDQTGRAFRHDIYSSMLDEGYVAIVPVDTTIDPKKSASFEIESARTGRIVEWLPEHVRVNVYNERVGRREDIIVPKKTTAIVENPFYSVMNESSSVMKRLLRKLALLDAIDEQSSSGKLDLIIQLPYVIKTEQRRQEADRRRQDIANQLSGSKYGIAYTDGTERITQLNRPVENNLMKQIEYLTSMLYGQLGITQGIMDGTADATTMLNYFNRVIEPIVSAVVDEMKRKFLSKTARKQHQTIMYFRDPFKLVPAEQLAEISDKLTRNEIATSNEIRQVIGWKPSKDPKADELRNKNLSEPSGASNALPPGNQSELKQTKPEEEVQNG